MTTRAQDVLRSVATKGVVAVLPIAMASAYATTLVVPTPPRLAAYDYRPAAEITVDGTTVGLADSSLYFLTDPTLTIDPVQVAKHLDEMQALGIDNVRVYVPWRYVETTEGQYDWSSMDVIMNLAAERNMGVLAAINTTPDWVDPTGQYSPGAAQPDAADFTDFVTAFATKYGSTVSAYEVWNEPNYVQFYDPVDPAAYTELLKAVYPALKAIDPTATVVAAGLGDGPTSGDAALSAVDFVAGMYAAGAKGYFDALAYHPYQATVPFSQGTADGGVLNQALAMVALMASNGDYVTGADGKPLLDADGNPVTKKIWATEYGLPTSAVTDQHQADFIKDFLATWATQSWAGPAYVYTTVDSLPGSDDQEGTYGVYTIDANGNWVAKPAAQVLAEWIAAHPNQTFDPTAPVGPSTPVNPLKAFTAFIQHVVAQFVHLSQSFVGAIVHAVTNWLGSFTKPAVAHPVTSSLRVAAVGAADTTAEGDPPDISVRKAPSVATPRPEKAEAPVSTSPVTTTPAVGAQQSDAKMPTPAAQEPAATAAATDTEASTTSSDTTASTPKPPRARHGEGGRHRKVKDEKATKAVKAGDAPSRDTDSTPGSPPAHEATTSSAGAAGAS